MVQYNTDDYIVPYYIINIYTPFSMLQCRLVIHTQTRQHCTILNYIKVDRLSHILKDAYMGKL